MNFKKIFLVMVLTTISFFVNAMPITGEIGFAGGVNDNGAELQFYGTTTFGASGTYAGLNGLSVAMSDITYVPFYSVSNPLWVFTSGFNTYSFELISLNDLSISGFALFSGLGVLSATGYDDTIGSWTYSDQGVTFSSQSSPINVVEPKTLVIFILGLIGICFFRFSKKLS